MAEAKCFICYRLLAEAEGPYHAACSRKFFDSAKPPELPYALNELDRLAEKVVRSHVTVPGVQAKLSLHLDKSIGRRGRLTLVGLWGNYILKPPVDAFPEMPEIEDLTMHLAAFFKIATVPHALIPLMSGELAYITKRIDREADGGKIHMEDMCQLTERLTEDKYKGSMEQVGKAILRFSSNPVLDVLRFFEIAVFSFLTGNADMHLKNFSLMKTNNMIVLTPAYDLLATRLLIPESEDAEEMALTLNGKKSKLTLSDFEKFGETIGLNSKQMENTLKRFREALPRAIDFIKQGFVSRKKQEELEALLLSRAARLHLMS